MRAKYSVVHTQIQNANLIPFSISYIIYQPLLFCQAMEEERQREEALRKRVGVLSYEGHMEKKSPAHNQWQVLYCKILCGIGVVFSFTFHCFVIFDDFVCEHSCFAYAHAWLASMTCLFLLSVFPFFCFSVFFVSAVGSSW